MRARLQVTVDVGRADEIAARFAARGGQPGLAYGLVAGGELVHAGGIGAAFTGGPVPQADTVFRIASMTKSFTASAIMLLREDGALRLDDPAQVYLPQLRGLRLPAADCRPLTIRRLLTMTAGFPTDDPWGDRQQGLPLADFDALISGGGVRCCWAPGTRFEYSNLGYALLGRIIATVTGSAYEDAIREMLLAPLGLDRTGFEAGEFSADDLARGYRRDDGGWLELTPDPSGAFASMGGVFSCVRDLARWVAGFADAFPARAGEGRPHPLPRSARREMQLAHVIIPFGGGQPGLRSTGPAAISYGFGLFAEEDLAHGSIVQHSGGYPGYGSHMRWHLATGTGAIVLANGTYAAAGALAGELLAAALAEPPAAAGYRMRGPVPVAEGTEADSPGAAGAGAAGPWRDTLAAQHAVNGLLLDWDDEVAGSLFTANVAQDRPLAQRRADIARLRERIGEFAPDPDRAAEFDSPAHCRWWLTGPRGRASVQIKLAPLTQPRVQQVVLAVPPAPDSALAKTIAAVIATINAGAAEWPADLAVAPGADLRQLRLAAAWAGQCQPGGWAAGDGSSTATVELTGATGRVVLTVEVSGPGQQLQRAEVTLLP